MASDAKNIPIFCVFTGYTSIVIWKKPLIEEF